MSPTVVVVLSRCVVQHCIMTMLVSFLPQQRPAPTHPLNSESSRLIDESPTQEAGLRLLIGLGRV